MNSNKRDTSDKKEISNIKEIFLNEAKEILTELESDLVLLEEGGNEELLNRIFRHAHTLKGSSAIAGYPEVSEFMHGIEDILDRLRSGELFADDRLTDHLLNAFDWVKFALFGDGSEPEIEAAREYFVGWMKNYTAPLEAQVEKEEAAHKEVGYWYYRVRARFGEDIFSSGIDPLAIMDDFVSLGQTVEVKVDDTGLPEFGALNPEKC